MLGARARKPRSRGPGGSEQGPGSLRAGARETRSKGPGGSEQAWDLASDLDLDFGFGS